MNGRHLLGRGQGEIDPDNGINEMEVTFAQMADGWDARPSCSCAATGH